MIKLLQKYNRYILVIGGTLLMIAFLVPELLRNVGSGGGESERFRVDGTKVSVGETADATGKLKSIESFGLGVPVARTGDHWFLLTQWAKQNGMMGNRFDGKDLVPAIAGEQFNQYLNAVARSGDQKRMQEAFSKMDETRKTIETNLMAATDQRIGQRTTTTTADALAEFRAVNRLASVLTGAPRLGEARLIAEAKRQGDTATVKYMFVPVSDQMAAAQPEPTAEQLQAHFEKYKDVPVNGGDLGIGYKQPDRVKLQYLTIDRSVIAAKVTVDPVEVQKRLMAKTEDKSPIEVRRSAVEMQLRNDRINEVLREAETAVKGELLRIASNLPDGGGYKTLPEPADWVGKVDLKAIGARVVAKLKASSGVDLPPFGFVAMEAGWSTAVDVGNIAGIGAASVQLGTVRVTAPEAIMGVRELRRDDKQRAVIASQVGLPITEAFEDGGRNAYFIMVTAMKKESAPESLAEVQADVTKNVRRLAAFEQLKADAPGFAVAAASMGFEVFSDTLRAAGKPADAIKSSVRVSRANGAQPAEAGVTSDALTEAVMNSAAKIDPTVPFSDGDAIGRTIDVPAPAKLGVVIAQIVEFDPLSLEAFRQQVKSGQDSLVGKSITKDVEGFRDAFALKRLLTQLKVTGLTEKDASDTAE